ncbi:MAG: hypothetical protein JXO48_07790 [Deltaproteobacteria bacterium]|nr:hypothetical protein [Deltaproteobacteria bacterium]
MILKLILIFASGIVVDLLLTRYTSAVAQKKIAWATILSGTITIVNFTLLTLILKDSATNGMFNIMAFAGGNTLGTYIALKKA